MKILFLGDIVGKPGRKTVQKFLPDLIKQKKPDLVIANAENLSGGKGVNKKTLKEMVDAGVDAFTGGNHSFKNPEGNTLYESDDFVLLRPYNLPPGNPGYGVVIIETKKGKKLLLISILGRTFMSQQVDCPFRSLDDILDSFQPSDYDACLVDVHAEATSEKQALRWSVDGKVSAVLGTHTHVPTADANISEKGTAFQCDVGMNGSFDSCIGVKKDAIVKMLKTQMPMSHQLETKGRMQFNATFLSIRSNGTCHSIHPIHLISPSLS